MIDEPASGSRTVRQQHEAAVYDERAEALFADIDDASLLIDPTHPPYPNREHVEFLDFMFDRLGDLRGRRIIEVGCGSGYLTTYFALHGATGVGVDVSEGMLAVARRRAEVNGVSERVELVAQPIETLDHADGSYDAIVANQVLHHLDIPRAMPNIARLLKPSGLALFAEPVLLLPPFVEKLRYTKAMTRFFPSRRDTPDERSIDAEALARICGSFRRSEIHHFQLTTRLQNFFELSDATFARLEGLDRRVLRRLPPARRLSRYVVLVLAGRPEPGNRPKEDRS